MKSTILISVLLIAATVANDAAACSVRGGYKIVKPVWHTAPDFMPPAPRVFVAAVERGFDDGSPGSCSDAGTLTFVTEDRPHPDIAGYTFEVTGGAFPDAVFPVAVLAPVDLGDGRRGFRFAWLDIPPGRHEPEPIDVTVEVRLVSNAGEQGPPLLLRILDEG